MTELDPREAAASTVPLRSRREIHSESTVKRSSFLLAGVAAAGALVSTIVLPMSKAGVDDRTQVASLRELAAANQQSLSGGLSMANALGDAGTYQTNSQAEIAALLEREAAERAAAEQAAQAAQTATTAGNTNTTTNTGTNSGTNSDTQGTSSGPGTPNTSVPNPNGNALISMASTRLGMKYVYGAAGPTQFDCSGLVKWAYAQMGINVPHGANSQANLGTKIPISQAQPGDLIWYPGQHISIYLGGGQVLEAANPSAPVRTYYMWGNPASAIRMPF